MSPLEFGDLPKPASTPRPSLRTWTKEAAELRAHPHQWALLTTKSTVTTLDNTIYRIRHGQLAAFRPAGAFEAKRRGLDVWVRYVGGAA